MMKLSPLANLFPLIPAEWDGEPFADSPPFPLKEFYSVLLNQLIGSEGKGEGGAEEDQANTEELFSPRSIELDERNPFLSQTTGQLLPLSVVDPLEPYLLGGIREAPSSVQSPSKEPSLNFFPHPLNSMISKEDQGGSAPFAYGRIKETPMSSHAQSTNPVDESEGFTLNSSIPLRRNPFEFPAQKPSHGQNVEEGWDLHSILESEGEKTGAEHGFPKEGVSDPIFERGMNRTNLRQEEFPSLSQMRREHTEISRGIWSDKGNHQKSLTPFHSDPDPFVRSERERPFAFEWVGKTLPTEIVPSSQESHELGSLKTPPSLFESSLQKGVELVFEKAPILGEGEGKVQHAGLPRTESFEIHRQVGRVLSWSAQAGEEKIHMRLDPPQLGELYIKVTKEREVLKATLWAENPTAKELLEIHREELRKVLEAEGFKLDKFEVFVQQETDRFVERRDASFLKGKRREDLFYEGPASHPSDPSPLSSSGALRLSGWGHYIDRMI